MSTTNEKATENTWEPKEIRKVDLRDYYLKDARLLAQRLLKRQAVSCSLTIPVQSHTKSGTDSITTTLPFYMSDNFGFGVGNKFESLVDQDNAGGLYTQLMNGLALFQDKTQVSMQSEAMSSLMWKGSTFTGFNVKCLFIATTRSFNTLNIVKMLAGACLPRHIEDDDETVAPGIQAIRKVGGFAVDLTKGLADLVLTGVEYAGELANKSVDMSKQKQDFSNTAEDMRGLIKGMGMSAPLQYGLTFNKENENDPENYRVTGVKPLKNTTLTLQIGNYFRAEDLVVDDISNISFSKELIAPPSGYKNKKEFPGSDLFQIGELSTSDYGFPLYVECDVKLRPVSMMTYSKFQSYFLNPAGGHNGLNKITDTTANIAGFNVANSFKLP